LTWLGKVNVEKGINIMLKTFRLVLVAILATAFIASVVGAQGKAPGEKAVWPTYYSLTDPGNTPLGQDPWVGPVPVGLPLGPLATSTTIWIGTENLQVDEQWKEWWLDIHGTSVFGLEAINVVGYDSLGSSTGYTYSSTGKSALTPGGVRFNVKIKPQPHWEVMELHVAEPAPVTIESIVGQSMCHRDEIIPSLTTYGIIVLVLLLIASTVWVLRRKKAGVPA
jgi:hypothetical protein